jgi:glycosyltransferase involved in cell wall biosynthesis
VRLWIAAAFDKWPCEDKNRRYSALGLELAKRGHVVTWFSPDFRHWTKTYALPKNNYCSGKGSFSVVPLHVPSYCKNRSIARLLSHRAYCRSLREVWKGLAVCCRPDIILAANGPPEACYEAALFAQRHQSKLVLDFREFWPDSLVRIAPRPLRPLARLLLRVSKRKLAYAVSKASLLCSVSKTCLSWANGLWRGGNRETRLYYLGTDMLAIETARKKAERVNPPGRPMRVVYIGGISHLYDLDTVIQATAMTAQSVTPVEWHLIGDGESRSSLETLANQLGLRNRVFFHGYLPFPDAASILVISDIGLVPIIANWDPNFPNKIGDYLGAGLAIASTIPGEIASLIAKEGVGYTYGPGKPHELANIVAHLSANSELLSQIRSRALNLARSEFDAIRIAERYASDLERMAGLS